MMGLLSTHRRVANMVIIRHGLPSSCAETRFTADVSRESAYPARSAALGSCAGGFHTNGGLSDRGSRFGTLSVRWACSSSRW